MHIALCSHPYLVPLRSRPRSKHSIWLLNIGLDMLYDMPLEGVLI